MLFPVVCYLCKTKVAQSPHNFNQKVLYCFDCALNFTKEEER